MTKFAKLSIPEAAAIMGVTPQFLRVGLRQKRFPFGTAVKFRRWAYYVNAERFYEYISKRKDVV
jgi:hypothetical protein